MEKSSRVYVAGQKTLIGSALLRELKKQGFENLIVPDAEPDLTQASEVDGFFDETRPEFVFVAAGKSGGIKTNQEHPAELIRDNLLVACHLIESAYRHRAKKLLYLASSCSYPKYSPQPMKVESLLAGPLEPTSEAYAVAKIAGMRLVRSYRQEYGVHFICGIPGDPFGPGDDFDPLNSHVIGALIRKMHDAKERGAPTVELWGTGRPRRGFIFVDDLAHACLFVMREYDGDEPINIAGGWDFSIQEVAELIQEVVGYEGELHFDLTKPDGCPVKLLDSSKLMEMGWRPQWSIRPALGATVQWFLEKERKDSHKVLESVSEPGSS